MSLTESLAAEKFLQDMYDADLGGKELDLNELSIQFQEIGVMNIHYIFYNSGLADNEEIRAHLRQYPGGNLVQLIKKMIDIRVHQGDYLRETLERIYGISEL